MIHSGTNNLYHLLKFHIKRKIPIKALKFQEIFSVKNSCMKQHLLNLFNKIFKTQQNKDQRISKNTILLNHFKRDLKDMGITLQPIVHEIKNKENLLYASQLIPTLPWLGLLKNGVYQITFPSDIQSQINRGTLQVTGGTARNQAGQIISHGKNTTPLIPSALVLYQLGVIVFGALHLQEINKSLKKINEKLNNIHNFQLDKRSAQINSHFQEFLHTSKGIVEFSKLGNMTEIQKRINIIKQIRFMNLSNLLHIQKNLQDKIKTLGSTNSSFALTSKREYENLSNTIDSHKRGLLDYKHSLFLDIICTKTEVNFSICKSNEEIYSRLSSQKNQLEFFKTHRNSFEKKLNQKTKELDGTFTPKETLKKQRKYLKNSWKKEKEIIRDFDTQTIKHIRSIKKIIKSQDQTIIVKKEGDQFFLETERDKKFKINRISKNKDSTTNRSKSNFNKNKLKTA